MAEGARRLVVESDLRKALDRDQLRLCYQTEVDLSTKSPFGVEALLRWQHPDRGLILPGDFLQAAEDTGLIVPIGEWVLAHACEQLAQWQRDGLCGSELWMSVNLSLRQLCDDRLLESVSEAISAAGIPPESLCLEITETTVVADTDRVVEQLNELKRLGVSLSLDDFGIGVSSLGALERYPVDMLKIDRSFVQRLTHGLRSQRLFAAVVGLAHSLDLRAVAEGVETIDQLEEIARVGCDAAQGFYLSEPEGAARVGPGLLAAAP